MDLQGAAEAQGLDNNDPGIAAMRQQSNKPNGSRPSSPS